MARLQETVTIDANRVIVNSGSLIMLLVKGWMCVLIGHEATEMARRVNPPIMVMSNNMDTYLTIYTDTPAM